MKKNSFVKEIEKKYGVRYIGYYDIPVADCVYVFWNDNPQKGHSNYLGVIPKLFTGEVLLINGKSIEDATYNAIKVDKNKYIVSRYRHDCQTGPNGEMVDGGLEYCRSSGEITHKMKVINGKEVYEEIYKEIEPKHERMIKIGT